MLLISIWAGLVVAPALILVGLLPIIIYSNTKPWKKWFIPKQSLTRISLLGILWIAISTIWSIKISASLTLFGQMIAMLAFAYSTYRYVQNLDADNCVLFTRLFSYSYVAAVILLLEEAFSKGFLGQYVMAALGSEFAMYNLNRGACILVIFFWPFLLSVKNFTDNKKHQYAISGFIWLLLGVGVFNQLSQSAMLGYLISSIIFIFVFFAKYRANIILQVVLVLGVFLNIYIVKNFSAENVVLSNPSLPASAIHRLFILDFVGKKSMENMMLGSGANVSRYVDGASDKVVAYKVDVMDDWVNIPLHTHNSVSQIWLELGLIGVIIFAAFLREVVARIFSLDRSNFEKTTYCSAMIAYVVIGLVGFGIWQAWWISTALMLVIFFAAIPRAIQQ